MLDEKTRLQNSHALSSLPRPSMPDVTVTITKMLPLLVSVLKSLATVPYKKKIVLSV